MKSPITMSALVATLIAAGPAIATDYVVDVNGIVCEFCSLGVRKNVSRLPFIDRTKYEDGVLVDIKNQMVTIAVRDGAELDKAALFKAITSAGYSPVEVYTLTGSGERVVYRP